MTQKCSYQNGKKVCKDENTTVYIVVGVLVVIAIIVAILLMKGCSSPIPADITGEENVPEGGVTEYYCCNVGGVNGCYLSQCPSTGVLVYEDFFNFKNQCKAQCNPASIPAVVAYDCDEICADHSGGQYVGGQDPQNGQCFPDFDPMLYQNHQCCCYAGNVPQPFVQTCEDSDNGADFYTAGECTEHQIDGAWTGYDICITTTRMNDYTCNQQTGECEIVYHACNSMTEQCLDGACVALVPN